LICKLADFDTVVAIDDPVAPATESGLDTLKVIVLVAVAFTVSCAVTVTV
jgi:hypothetical protein